MTTLQSIATVTGVLLGGLVVGIGLGVLYAPQSGARTRRQLRDVTHDVSERIGEIGLDARYIARRAVETGKGLMANPG